MTVILATLAEPESTGLKGVLAGIYNSEQFVDGILLSDQLDPRNQSLLFAPDHTLRSLSLTGFEMTGLPQDTPELICTLNDSGIDDIGTFNTLNAEVAVPA
jgi:hypothetical protein